MAANGLNLLQGDKAATILLQLGILCISAMKTRFMLCLRFGKNAIMLVERVIKSVSLKLRIIYAILT